MRATVSLRVIGAGVGRTGTSSLTAALTDLLGAPCYHFEEVIRSPQHAELWAQAVREEFQEWEQLYAGFAASMDWPGAAFWHELSDYYPDALVILSKRRDAEEWFASARGTVGVLVGNPDPYRTNPLWLDMTADLLKTRFVAAPFEREGAMAAYENHNAEVRRTIPPNRLLEWVPGDGWGPICERLNLPMPNRPFPHLNTRREFQASLHQAADAPRKSANKSVWRGLLGSIRRRD